LPKPSFNSETAKAARAKAGPKRSRDQIIADTLNEYLEKSISIGDNRTRQEIMVEAAYKEWLKGNSKPFAYLMDRGFAKPKQDINIGGQKDNPFILVTPEMKAMMDKKK
jgi:hypothetical protein